MTLTLCPDPVPLLHKEILSLLQRPFFFQLIISGSLALPEATQPRDIFNAFLTRLTSDFHGRFGIAFDLTRPLASLAYDAINKGEEAIPGATAIRMIHDYLASAGIGGTAATDVVNWLVGRDFLLPFSGGRVAFFHQSITEYLAATELARRYTDASHILRENLILRRWDQALFLTLSLLPWEQEMKFVEAIIEMDFSLALSAVKFMESGRDEIVERLLCEMPKRVKVDRDALVDYLEIAWALESSLPVSLRHEPALRTLIKLGNQMGGAAASRLLSLRGDEVRAELLELMVENCDDYNFCTRIGEALGSLISDTDIPRLVALTDRVQERLTAKEIEDYQGFDSALGQMLLGLSPRTVYDSFYDRNKPFEEQRVRLSVLCDFLQKSKSAEALNVCSELVLAGVAKASFCIHMIGSFDREKANMNWSSFGDGHISSLIQFIADEEHGAWAINALRDVCIARPDLAPLVRDACVNTHGILRVALLFAISVDDQGPVFDTLNALCNLSPEQLSIEPIGLLSHLELNWAGHENLFVRLLRLRHAKLALKLLDTTYGKPNTDLVTLEIGPIEWWLEWIKETAHTDDGWWLQDRLSWLFANKLAPEMKDAFVREFNRQNSPYRSILASRILLARNDLFIDEFGGDAISFLLADLSSRKYIDALKGHLIGSTATEAFVIDRLLPLLPNAEEPLRGNLVKVLRQAGKRHGRRYVAT